MFFLKDRLAASAQESMDLNSFKEDDANEENGEREDDKEALEDESDDDLFLEPPPSLDDDEDDLENGVEEEEDKSRMFEDTSNSVPHLDDDNDGTYGSPGLREAFQEDDDDQSKSGTPDLLTNHNSRKNKRKNFKPRNIVYSNEDEEGEQQNQDKDHPNEGPNNAASDDGESHSGLPLNLSGDSILASQRKSLLPRKLDAEKETSGSSPMDLSCPAPEMDGESQAQSFSGSAGSALRQQRWRKQFRRRRGQPEVISTSA